MSGKDEATLKQRIGLGQSGFELVAHGEKNIQKRSGRGDPARLARQCAKQSEFFVNSPAFRVGEVLDFNHSSEHFSFVMPFYRAETVLQFIDRASPFAIDTFADDLFRLIHEFIEASSWELVSLATVLEKSDATIKKIQAPHDQKKKLNELWEFHRAELSRHSKGFFLPVGKCHGDLVFSNILFERDRHGYILIDFLDAYFESPIHDLAKIRQETRLRWSAAMAGTTPTSHDQAKYRLVMDYIDSKLLAAFSSQEFFSKYSHIFEFQNLLRLLPYTTNPALFAAIVSELESMQRRL